MQSLTLLDSKGKQYKPIIHPCLNNKIPKEMVVTTSKSYMESPEYKAFIEMKKQIVAPLLSAESQVEKMMKEEAEKKSRIAPLIQELNKIRPKKERRTHQKYTEENQDIVVVKKKKQRQKKKRRPHEIVYIKKENN